MGQTLSEPVTHKETSVCSGRAYRVAVSSMQGWRVSMEDAHTALLALPTDPGAAFFAVFDGHGGSATAQHCSRHLHRAVLARQEYGRGDLKGALVQGYLDLDLAMQQDEKLRDDMSGSTAVSCLIKDGSIYCANAGDSRAVASVAGRTLELSTDHKPSLPGEQARIEAAGGWVDLNRVNGNLALSRALGDFVFKRNQDVPQADQVITALPEVTVHAISDEWEFVVLACDGVWDVMSSEEVVQFIRGRLCQGMTPEVVSESLLNRCLAPNNRMSGLGCDNMTVTIVCLLAGDTWQHFTTRLSQHGTLPPPLSDSSDEEDEEAVEV